MGFNSHGEPGVSGNLFNRHFRSKKVMDFKKMELVIWLHIYYNNGFFVVILLSLCDLFLQKNGREPRNPVIKMELTVKCRMSWNLAKFWLINQK